MLSFQAYLLSFMVMLASWNSTAGRTIMNESSASGADRLKKCFHITVHLGCVCLCWNPECQEALFRDWGIKSSRDILRRFRNRRGQMRSLCYLWSVRFCCFLSENIADINQAPGGTRGLFFETGTHTNTQNKCMWWRHVLCRAVLSPVRPVKVSPLSRQSSSFHHSGKISICVGARAAIPHYPGTDFVPSSQEALLSAQALFTWY